MSDKVRAKVELIFGEDTKPEVKLFGDVRARDIRMSQLYIRRKFRQLINDNNRKIRRDEIEKQSKEEANKLKEAKNESRITEQVKARSRDTKTSSTGSGTDSRPGDPGTIQTT